MTVINGYDVTLAPIIMDGHQWFFVKNKRGEEKAFIDTDIMPYLKMNQPGMAWYKGQPWDDDMTEDMVRQLTTYHGMWLARTQGRGGDFSIVMTYHPDAEAAPQIPDDIPYLGPINE